MLCLLLLSALIKITVQILGPPKLRASLNGFLPHYLLGLRWDFARNKEKGLGRCAVPELALAFLLATADV